MTSSRNLSGTRKTLDAITEIVDQLPALRGLIKKLILLKNR
jgi:hypothetical protein